MRIGFLTMAACIVAAASTGVATPPSAARPRLRELGIRPGIFQPGPLNAITDVDGVRVGLTAVLPHSGNLFQLKTPAAVYVGNGRSF